MLERVESGSMEMQLMLGHVTPFFPPWTDVTMSVVLPSRAVFPAGS